MKSLNTIVSAFINRDITPGIRKETIYAAREVGGLGVINPKVQQLSLSYRWLKPTVFCSRSSPDNKFTGYSPCSYSKQV
jgi:hypothetical protein